MTKTIISRIATLIADNDNFALICHTSPDGDTLGSALALYIALTRIGKRACVICDSPVPNSLRDLSRKGVVRTVSTLDDPVFAIAIDCGDTGRMGNAVRFFEKAQKTVCIDHHSTNTGYADINLIVPTACATSEIIWKLIKTLGVAPDMEIGLCAYIGLSTDTGNFTYSNTTPGAFSLAAEMLNTGFDLTGVSQRIFRERSEARTRVIGICASNMKLLSKKRIAVSALTLAELRQAGATEEDTEGASAFLRDIDTVEAAACIREIDSGVFKVSFRSKYYLNVAAIASSFGGGGHARAAGCTIKASLNNVLRMVERALIDAIEGK